MLTIDKELLDELTDRARLSPRLRMNRNFHHSPEDAVQQMLNAIEPGSYLRPHRHPHIEELFLMLRGSGLLLIFDEAGFVTNKTELSPDECRYGILVPKNTWHTLIVFEPGTVVFEVKPGPYRPTPEADFAPWSPDPSDEKATAEFMRKFIA